MMKTIGQQIAYYRKKKKLSQEQLAELTGISGKQAIYAIENGVWLPSGKTLQKIADALGCVVETKLKLRQK